MRSTRRLWTWLGLVCLASFAVLLWLGRDIYLAAPPIPNTVVSENGRVIFTGEQIRRGQQVWLASGGQQLGTVWGHGSYVAPDWSADWLHREALELRDAWARQQFGAPYEKLPVDQQGMLDARLKHEMRANRYDAANDRLTLSDTRGGGAASRLALRSVVRRRPVARHAARPVRDDGGRRAGRGRPHRARVVLLLVRVVGDDRSSRRNGHDVHEQLAARAARGQHADRRERHVVDRERDRPARRDRRDGLVSHRARRARCAARRADERPALQREADAVDARDEEVLLRRDRPAAHAGLHGRDHRALCGGRPQLLRHSARGRDAVGREPHDPYAVRGALDRDRLARDGPLYLAAAVRPRAEAAKTRRGRAVLGADLHRRRLDRHRLARLAQASRHELLVLDRQSGARLRAWAASGRSCSSSACCSGCS